jgi:hypothetical protein
LWTLPYNTSGDLLILPVSANRPSRFAHRLAALPILTDTGDLIVAKKTPKLEQVSRCRVAESAGDLHLVALNHRILVKESNSLLLWLVD